MMFFYLARSKLRGRRTMPLPLMPLLAIFTVDGVDLFPFSMDMAAGICDVVAAVVDCMERGVLCERR